MNSKRCHRPLLLASALLALSSGVPARAQAPAPAETQLTLAAAIRSALAHNPLLRAEDLEVQAVAQRVRAVRAQRSLPSMRLNTDTGVVPEAKGDVFSSPNNADSVTGLGPFVRLEFGFVLPLYTFGALGNVEEAARHGVAARDEQRNKVRNKLALEVAKTYTALASTRRASEVAGEMRDQYDTLTEEVHRRYEEEPEGFEIIDDTDVLEIDANRFLVDRLAAESANGVRLAQTALNVLLQRAPEAPVQIEKISLPRVRVGEEQIAALAAVAERRDPQVRALQAAVAAKEAQIGSQRARNLPGVFLLGGAGFARAGNRTDQKNPFVLDEFNFFRAGGQFRITWNLDFAQNRIEVARLRIEREAMVARQQALSSKLYADVARATRDLVLATELLAGARESERAARNWLRLALDNWELGIGEVKRLLDAYKSFYGLRFEVIQRELAVAHAVAELAFAVGDADLYLKWMADGEVTVP